MCFLTGARVSCKVEMYLSPGSKNSGDIVERQWHSRHTRGKMMLLVDIFRVVGFGEEVFFRGLSVCLFFNTEKTNVRDRLKSFAQGLRANSWRKSVERNSWTFSPEFLLLGHTTCLFFLTHVSTLLKFINLF